MAGLSTYAENALFGWLRGTAMPGAPAATWLALWNGDPGDAAAGGADATATIRPGGRVAAAFGTPSGGAMANGVLIALSVLAEIAAQQIKVAIGGGDRGGGLIGVGTKLLGAALGLPGRATGGPVAPGRAYMVGERGPEMFVPTSSGRIEAPVSGGGRDVRVAIRIEAAGGGEPQALARSGRQVAQAVRRALEAAER